jgi:hypothetical protein
VPTRNPFTIKYLARDILTKGADGFGRVPADAVALMKEIANYCDSHRAKFGLSEPEELPEQHVKAIKNVEPGAVPNAGSAGGPPASAS